MTKIEWTKRPGTKGESWNMIGGCSKVSDGCTNCYALSMSWRLQNNPKRPDRYEGVVKTERGHLQTEDGRWLVEHHWTGRVNLDYDALEIPYRWKKPRTVFVCSMADLFHEKVSEVFIYDAFYTMRNTPHHTYLVLTKRPQRMHEVVTQWGLSPAPNIWLGVTAENQEQADLRIPLLLQTPAAVRWVSVEPMLGAINAQPFLRPYPNMKETCPGLNWIVIGAESGPNRRRLMNVHVHSLITQCDAAGVKTFVKQLHKLRDRRFSDSGFELSKDPSEWHESLRRREWPK